MEVHGPGSLARPSPVLQPQSVQAARAPETANPAMQAGDHVEISEMGRILDEISRVPDVRADKVAELRHAIQAGTYETPEKLEIAVERLLADIGGG
jgi:negative regulator of flagellin synthesis FlgM